MCRSAMWRSSDIMHRRVILFREAKHLALSVVLLFLVKYSKYLKYYVIVDAFPNRDINFGKGRVATRVG